MLCDVFFVIVFIIKVTVLVSFNQLVNTFKQMEDKQRKQAEERERIRIAEENEQKRVAMERARMQQQYEEEKRREEKKRVRSCTKSDKLPSHI